MSAHDKRQNPVYGLMAEFDSAQDLIEAAHRTREAGFKKIDAYSPFPIEGMAEAIGFHKNGVPLVVLIGGLVGLVAGYGLQYWIATMAYPVNVGGKPFHSWPSFIVVTFEMTILFAGLSAVFGMLALNGLPMPYHPVFNVPRFPLASKDRYFRSEIRRCQDAPVPRRVSSAIALGGAKLAPCPTCAHYSLPFC